MENDLDEIENEVFSETRINPTERIFRLKRYVLTFHRAVEPFEAGIDRLFAGPYSRSAFSARVSIDV